MDNNVTFYTTATESYDGFGTKTLELTDWADSRGKQVRKIAIPQKAIEWQKGRNISGGHSTLEASEFEEMQGDIFSKKIATPNDDWYEQYDSFSKEKISGLRKDYEADGILDIDTNQMKAFRIIYSNKFPNGEKVTQNQERVEFTEVKPEENPAPLEVIVLQNADGQDNSYVPQSQSCRTVDTVSPASMRYDMHKAIETIDRAVSGVDDYVAEKLGYYNGNCSTEQKKTGLKCLCDAFSAEQVDAIAVAIYNIEEKGQGCIIGDQTGIGKGRIAAGMIRYAINKGLKPIFLTEKPNLFSDLFRDVVNIGSDDAIPLELFMGFKEVEKRSIKPESNEDDEEPENDADDKEDETEIVRVNVYKPNKTYPHSYTYTEKDENGNSVTVTRQGKRRAIPFIINGSGSKTAIKDESGNILYKGSDDLIAKVIGKSVKTDRTNGFTKTGNVKYATEFIGGTMDIPEGFDFALATYSQFRGATDSPKMQYLLKIAKGNVIIMDESHNASGASNVGAYLRKVLEVALGCTFLSATFAKRPDNMPIYAGKTSLSDANLSNDDLIAAIDAGGVALQEIVSAGLVSEGQMIRRERSFEGIEVNYEYLDSSQAKRGFPNLDLEQSHKAIMDMCTDIIRNIMDFQRDYVNPEIAEMDKNAKAEYKQASGRKGMAAGGVDNQPIFSGIFNIINQLLFSIKAESVADVAIQRLKEGKKPVIAFANTMESFLNTMTNDDGSPVEENDIINSDFSKIFEKRLNSVLRYTVKDAEGNSEPEMIDVTEMDGEFQAEYNRILTKIKQGSVGISSSPIDVLVHRINSAGYTCAEVTGRDRQLKIMPNGKAMIKSRVKVGANDAFRQFNSNEVDCLLINQSGSTGASAHALPNAKVPADQVRQRVMIILQAELNINTEVQKRGRINRTGQIFKPIYDYPISAIPAEKRLMMMLQKKLKSLDANTTSSQKQNEELMDARQTDFLNKYGDQIVVDFLRENPLINLQIGDPLKMQDLKEGESPNIIDAAHRVSGRVAILSCKDQENFYTELSSRYVSAVEYLIQAGEYDLEVENMNLDAATLEKEVVVVGKGGKSVFGRHSILEKVSVNNLKKPYSKLELDAMLKESLGEFTTQALTRSLIEKYERFVKAHLEDDIQAENEHYNNLIEGITAEKQIAKAQNRSTYIADRTNELNDARNSQINKIRQISSNKSEHITRILSFFTVGKVIGYPSVTFAQDGQFTKGIFLGFVINENVKNPYAPSALKLRFAIAGSQRYIAVPASKFDVVTSIIAITYANIFSREQENMINNWDEIIKEKSSARSIRYIVTGNILQAFGKQELKGSLISYTTSTGGVKKGILLPEGFSKDGDGRRGGKEAMRITVPIITALPIIKSMVEGRGIVTNDGFSILRKEYDYRISVSASKQKGGKFYLDAILMALTNEGTFNKVGDQMSGTLALHKINNLVEYLQATFSCTVALVKQEFDRIKDTIVIEDYADEERKPEPVAFIEKLLNEDSLEEAARKEKADAEAFEAEQLLRAEELAKLEAEKKEGELFLLEKRKLDAKKKLINLLRIMLLNKDNGATLLGKEIEEPWVVYNADTEEKIAVYSKRNAAKRAMDDFMDTGNYRSVGIKSVADWERNDRLYNPSRYAEELNQSAIARAKKLGAIAYNAERMRVPAQDKELMDLIAKNSGEVGSGIPYMEAWVVGFESARPKFVY